MEFLKRFEAYGTEKKMWKDGQKLVIALSGGADSVCLFRCLLALRSAYRLELLAVHVNHGIRGEKANADQRFVEELCRQHEVTCLSFVTDVPAVAEAEKLTLEEAGRKVRYEILNRVCRQYGMDRIAIAHNANDQAETVLFHMFRGTSLKGMGGIRPVSGHCIRPLLFAQRTQIEKYLIRLEQPWREDESNRSEAYARNRIRRQVLPEARKINSEAVEHIARLAGHFDALEEFLEEATQQAAERVVRRQKEGIFLQLAALQKEHPLIADRLILAAAAEMAGSRKDLSDGHIRQLKKLAEQKNGANVDLPYGLYARREYESICISKRKAPPECMEGKIWADLTKLLEMPEKEETFSAENEMQSGEKELLLPEGRLTAKLIRWDKNFDRIPKNSYTKWFDYDKIKNAVVLRTRRTGDYMVIDAAGHKKKLKEIWINEKLPKRVRDRKLLLAEEDHILWVPGGRMSEFYKVTPDTERVLVCDFYTGENGGNDDGEYQCDDSGAGADKTDLRARKDDQ